MIFWKIKHNDIFYSNWNINRCCKNPLQILLWKTLHFPACLICLLFLLILLHQTNFETNQAFESVSYLQNSLIFCNSNITNTPPFTAYTFPYKTLYIEATFFSHYRILIFCNSNVTTNSPVLTSCNNNRFVIGPLFFIIEAILTSVRPRKSINILKWKVKWEMDNYHYKWEILFMPLNAFSNFSILRWTSSLAY